MGPSFRRTALIGNGYTNGVTGEFRCMGPASLPAFGPSFWAVLAIAGIAAPAIPSAVRNCRRSTALGTLMVFSLPLQFDLSSEHFQKLRDPCWMRGPGGCSHQLPMRVRVIHGKVHVLAASASHVRRNGRIAAALFAFEHSRRG